MPSSPSLVPSNSGDPTSSAPPVRVTVIIPAFNEEEAITGTVVGLKAALDALGHPHEVIVADNGSDDATAVLARGVGAVVVTAPERGYGAACLAGIAALRDDSAVVVFADGDGADDPQDIGALIAPILSGKKDLVIGSRALGETLQLNESGSLTAPQRFGNRLSCSLIRVFFGMTFTDLGPFRAISLDALRRLQMDDPNFGWTVQMQARAARLKLRVADIPVHYRRRRGGVSKVSGNLKGSVLAGTIILRTVSTEAASALLSTTARRLLPASQKTREYE